MNITAHKLRATNKWIRYLLKSKLEPNPNNPETMVVRVHENMLRELLAASEAMEKALQSLRDARE